MTYTVPAEFESFIASRVASGEFPSSDELIAEAIRRLQDEHEFVESLKEAEREIDAGGGIDGEEAHRLLREYARNIGQGRP